MIAARSVSFDPYIDDDMSSLCNTCVATNDGPALRQGKYSRHNTPQKEKDLISAKDLDLLGLEDFDSEKWNGSDSKLSKPKKMKARSKSYSGEIYGRCKKSSLLFRRWSEYTWHFAKPSTLLLFGSNNDLSMYQSPYLESHQKEKLVKFAIDFDTSGKLTEKARNKHKSFEPPPIPSNFVANVNRPVTYVVTDIKSKVYKAKNPNLYNFKIIRWNNFDRKTVAAFGSYDYNSLEGFHKSLAKCVKRANKASHPKLKSDRHSILSGESSLDDSSLASHNTGISLWSYYTAGSRRSGKSRSRNKLNKMKLNEQFRQ